MVFRSKYCAECGSELLDSKGGIISESKFCNTCKPAFRKGELLSRFGSIGLATAAMVFGAGSYLIGPAATPLEIRKGEIASTAPAQKPGSVNEAGKIPGKNDNITENAGPEGKTNSAAKLFDEKTAPKSQSDKADGVYICSARTSKGMPCSRRVKKGERCWQHAGRHAMQAADKFEIQ